MCRRKINIVLIFLVISSVSCRSLRVAETGSGEGDYMVRSEKFFREVNGNNLTSGPVSINRIIIRYTSGGQSRRLRANMKYDGRDKMLISIRTFAGIEAARIFAEGDSVKINDRINRICYRGTNEDLSIKYGLSVDDIGLLLGDMIEIGGQKGKIACVDGQVKVVDMTEGTEMEYIIDCSNQKLMVVRGSTGPGNNDVRGLFKEFTDNGEVKYPAEVKWNIADRNTEIELELGNVQRKENMSFVFREGKGYTVKSIL